MVDPLTDVLDFMGQLRIRSDELDGTGFISAEAELFEYYQQHAIRFVKTLEMLRMVFGSQSHPRVLDLGAAPYYLTAYLVDRWGWEIVPVSVKAGVWPGVGEPLGKKRVILDAGQHSLTLDVSVFNIEKDRFPFDSAVFDGVLCLETIEHLGYSPSYTLAECHRVIKPGGTLVVSTPNSINLLNTLRMILNMTTAFHYSGYGFYGRHQREFTANELRLLCEACNFKVTHLDLMNISRPFDKGALLRMGYAIANVITSIPIPYFKAKREHIILAAQSIREPIEAYPDSLYTLKNFYMSSDHSAKQNMPQS